MHIRLKKGGKPATKHIKQEHSEDSTLYLLAALTPDTVVGLRAVS